MIRTNKYTASVILLATQRSGVQTRSSSMDSVVLYTVQWLFSIFIKTCRTMLCPCCVRMNVRELYVNTVISDICLNIFE